jgi:hypothetical protein
MIDNGTRKINRKKLNPGPCAPLGKKYSIEKQNRIYRK